MNDVPDHAAVGYWLVGLFWGTAAICYFLDGPADLIVILLSMGQLVVAARLYLDRQTKKD